MLTSEVIEKNKQEFISLLNFITRPGFKKDELISKLENSDFFTAPASTQYHGSYKGGLCEHCLSVYKQFVNLVSITGYADLVSQETAIIICLFHDFSKMNFYKIDYRNVKVYSDHGTKSDNGGRFDWETKQIYSVIPAGERFVYGNHEETAEFMTRQYIPLTYSESSAIINHHSGMGWDSAKTNISDIYNRYPEAMLLHLADMLDTYSYER